MWVDVKTRRDQGPYASPNMRRFNQALAKAHARYPHLRVYDWSRAVIDQWFDGDGIHLTSDGYAYRSVLIADALADAFPDSSRSDPGGAADGVDHQADAV